MDDIKDYPMDIQVCRIRWNMIPERIPPLNIEFSPVSRKPDNDSSLNWDVEKFGFVNESDCYVLVLSRLPETALATVVIPVICFNVLVALVFLLPPSSGERVGYSVTLVLSFSVLLMSITKMVPSSPDNRVNIGNEGSSLFILVRVLLFF